MGDFGIGSDLFGNLKGCAEEECGEDLFLDPLTALPNRTKLIRDIENNDCPVLFLINIDGFSQINNHFGYETGDAVLVSVAGRLDELFSDPAFMVYRLHADEYAVLTNISGEEVSCGGISWDEIPWELFECIGEQIAATIGGRQVVIGDGSTADGYEIALNVTIGIAIARIVGNGNLLTRADTALKTAKKERKPFLFYKQSTRTRKVYEKNIHWAGILKKAIENDRVVPFFQPIVNNQTRQIEKYESLVRIEDESGRPLTPFHFIGLSKILRIYPLITRTIIQKSFKATKKSSQTVSINLSIEDILDASLKKFISDLLETYQIGERVHFEILESEGVENYEAVKSFISSFQNMGCKIGIDDFGIGYSNFSHLLRLKVDFIKFDASLIKHIDMDRHAQIIVKSIVGFAKELGIQTIGEYVFSKSIYETVREVGVDSSQGYFFGKPQPDFI